MFCIHNHAFQYFQGRDLDLPTKRKLFWINYTDLETDLVKSVQLSWALYITSV